MAAGREFMAGSVGTAVKQQGKDKRKKRIAVVLVLLSAVLFSLRVSAEKLPPQLEKAITGTLRQADHARDAQNPPVFYASRAGGAYRGSSYAEQLDDPAAITVYQSLVSYYVSQDASDALVIRYQEPFCFSLSYEWNASKEKYVLEPEHNAGYMEVRQAIDAAFQSAFDAFAYDYPQVFWLRSFTYRAPISYTETKNGYDGKITEITLTPVETYAGAKAEKASFKAAVTAAVREIRSRASHQTGGQAALARVIHDYVCETAVYTDGVPYAHSAGGFFVHGGRVVCEGYAKAYKILCGAVGIQCILVVGNANGAHMWNYVCISDSWYLVDTTWDDQAGKTYDTYFLAGSNTTGWTDGADGRLTVGSERILYTNFSGSESSVNFAYPRLAGTGYSGKVQQEHVHIWVEREKCAPTCTEEGYTRYSCICGESGYERLGRLGHSYKEGRYVYNNDATCVNDGTQTAVCDRGCGAKSYTVRALGTKLSPTAEVTAKTIRLQKGQRTSLFRITGLGVGDYVRKWESSDKKIVKVSGTRSGTCVIHAKKKTGNAKIKVTLASGLTVQVRVIVQSGKVRTEKITGTKKKLVLKEKEAFVLTPVCRPFTSQEKIRYTSSNKKVASVNAKGRIKAKKKGRAVISITSGKKTVRCRVTVR